MVILSHNLAVLMIFLANVHCKDLQVITGENRRVLSTGDNLTGYTLSPVLATYVLSVE